MHEIFTPFSMELTVRVLWATVFSMQSVAMPLLCCDAALAD